MMIRIRKYLPELVYGGIDGAVTTFAVTAGVVGAGLSPSIILILGFANLFADGFSMAASNYLSVKSDVNEKNKEPLKTASATFISFLIVGAVPVLPYVGLLIFPNLFEKTFLIASVATGIAFFLVGASKAYISRNPIWLEAIETLLIGAAAAGISYYIGYLLSSFA